VELDTACLLALVVANFVSLGPWRLQVTRASRCKN